MRMIYKNDHVTLKTGVMMITLNFKIY